MHLSVVIDELKRRRVFRVIVGYGVIAFALLQVVEPIQHALSLPDSVLKIVVGTLALGFPAAVVLAWAFDVNAGAVERTAAATAPELRGPRLAVLLVGLGLLAAAPGAGYYFWIRRAPEQPPAGKKSIAVLPFVNMSGEKDNEYFSDGVSEEILNQLAQTPGLQVAARTSSFAFKGKEKSAPEIARELEVRMVLEGSVRRQGGRVRITAQLIDAVSGFHLWSQTYDRELQDIFAIQEEIARAIAAQLQIKLGEAREPSRPTSDLAAWDLYLRGLALWQARGRANLDAAEQLFREAAARDPGLAKAWAGIALVEAIRPDWFHSPPQASYAIAHDAAEHALAIDPLLPDAFAALGLVAGNEGHFQTSRALFDRAKAIAPSYGTAWHWSAGVVISSGDLERGIEEGRRAVELDPKSAQVRNNQAEALFYAGRDAEAMKLCEAVLADVPGYRGCIRVEWTIFVLRKDYQAARRLMLPLAEARGPAAAQLQDELMDALEGKRDAAPLAARLLPLPDGEVHPDSPTVLTDDEAIFWFIAAGRNGDALSRLERLEREEPQVGLPFLIDRHTDPLRCEPRFAALTKEAGFVDARAETLCERK